MQDACKQISLKVSLQQKPRFHTAITEKAWLMGCGHLWESLCNSEMLNAYFKEGY